LRVFVQVIQSILRIQIFDVVLIFYSLRKIDWLVQFLMRRRSVYNCVVF